MRLFLFTLFSLAALAPAFAAEKKDTQPDTCRAQAHSNLIGKTEAQLADVIFKTRSVRVLAEGAPATMDYRADRLNILLDATGKVKEMTCG